jgi:membrane protease YdiL (CAAX protease family)
MNNYAHAPTRGPNRPALAAAPARPRSAGIGRLIAWLVLVGVLAAMSFAGNALVSEQTSQPQSPVYYSEQTPDGGTASGYMQPAAPHNDAFYHYVTGIGGFVQYAIILTLVLLIAHGLPRRQTFALYRPKSWPRATGLVLGVLAATYVASGLVAAAIGSGGQPDQALPDFWDGSRAGQFALMFIVIAVVAPIVEELTFRGLGFGLLSGFGSRNALLATAVLFGLYHGFVIALPLFVIAGLALGWLRMRTGSVYPCMVMHGLFNASALILAVSVG